MMLITVATVTILSFIHLIWIGMWSWRKTVCKNGTDNNRLVASQCNTPNDKSKRTTNDLARPFKFQACNDFLVINMWAPISDAVVIVAIIFTVMLLSFGFLAVCIFHFVPLLRFPLLIIPRLRLDSINNAQMCLFIHTIVICECDRPPTAFSFINSHRYILRLAHWIGPIVFIFVIYVLWLMASSFGLMTNKLTRFFSYKFNSQKWFSLYFNDFFPLDSNSTQP